MNFSSYTIKKIPEILREFNSSLEAGLSQNAVIERQKKYGFNEIKERETYWWHILWRQFKSAFIYLLIIAAGLAFLLGEEIEGLLILAFIVINVFLGFYQEYRSEKAIKLLKQYIVHKTVARRQGKEIVVNSTELVPGDIVIVEAGDIIPADIRFLKENDLMIDESILTGESAPVRKIVGELTGPAQEIYKAQNIGFSGTMVNSGEGEGIVFATARNTAIGDVSHLTAKVVRESSFEKRLVKISKFIFQLVFITLIVVFLVNLLIKGENAHTGELLIFSIALAVSVVPEALPVVTILSLSRGALHLAKNKVVVKRLSAIEDLGGIEVLCTDKTGTITENKLKVAEIYGSNARDVSLYAVLAVASLNKDRMAVNSFDSALWNYLSSQECEKTGEYQKIDEIPFDPERKHNSVLVKNKKENKYELIVRGEPGSIIKYTQNLNDEESKSVEQWIIKEGKWGHRVLAIAKKEISGRKSYDVAEEEEGLSFLGVVSFVDPIKKTAKSTFEKAKSLGIKIKILTGDSREVAGTVAYQVGLIGSSSEVIVGEEFDKMSIDEQHKAVEKYFVFARVSPQQKYKIIQLLEETYEVGFLGEGINDAPALKVANAALVVDSASDIAREAADIILLEKSLKAVVDGIQEGRKIFANISKYIRLTLASNFGNFYAVASASLILNYLPMLPLQILLLNLLSDFPMIAIATDNVDAEEMKKPKKYDVKEISLLAAILGPISTIFDFIFFGLFYRFGQTILQTNWFIGSMLTELILPFSIRTRLAFFKARRPSGILLWLLLIAAILTVAIPFTKVGQEIFKFEQPAVNHLVWIFGLVIVYFILTEIVKLSYHRISNHKNNKG